MSTASPRSDVVPAVAGGVQPPEGSAGRSTYGQILKSSAVIGGSSVVTVVISIFRVKLIAVLLGPAGVGLLGLFTAIQELAQSVAGAGLNSSGVRQIAYAAGTGDSARVARTAAVLRQAAVVLGLLGGALVVVCSGPLSRWTFGTDAYAGAVALLSAAVAFKIIGDGHTAVIQGMRRINQLARLAIFGAASGTGAGLAAVYVLGEAGLAPLLICVSAATALLAWHYARQLRIEIPVLTRAEVIEEASALLKLGCAFMASAVLMTGAAYGVRALVAQTSGLEAAGLYQAAWALGGLYVGFILQAMGSDFYPRLTAVAENDAEVNRLVNEQALIGLLLAGPGVIGTLTFAPLVVSLFYSGSFADAVAPLRWICLGMALRVIAWPMGYIVLAKGARAVFFVTELLAALVHVGAAALFVRWFGLAGATMAFFALYVWHGILIYAIVRRLSGFRWSVASRRVGMLFLPVVGAVFWGFHILPHWVATIVGAFATVAAAVYSLRAICQLIPADRVPAFMRPVVRWFQGRHWP